MSAATATVSLGQGAGLAPIAGALPLASLVPYHLTYPYPPLSRCVSVPELRRFKAKSMLECTSWQRACENIICINSVYFSNNASKVNWLLIHLETGPQDIIVKYFKACQSGTIMWEAFYFLLLDYVGLPETRQQAAPLVLAKYKQCKDQSVIDYTKTGAYLITQLSEDYP